jgi:RecA-family ATPase
VLHDAILAFNKEALYPVGLLINDPLIAFFGEQNFNKAQDCQTILKGLKRLCEELQISIIDLMHFNKTQGASAKEKTGGSQRLVEAHRMAWSFTLVDDTDKESNTLISPIKKNLLKVAKSYEITTVSTPVEWEEDGVKKRDEVGVFKFVRFSDETADGQLLEKASKDRSKQHDVRDGVLEVLKQGKRSPASVFGELKDVASKTTIEREVRKLINSGKVKREGTGPSNTMWMLAAEPHQAEFDKTQPNKEASP